ncbi:MAG: Gx transporter family protein [Clostridia bacterium]|nr:Gx transporter family protein [Clostridia bacterium]
MKTKKLTALALTISFAMILSYLESRMPALVAIPGIKIGFANIAIIFALYKFGVKEAVTVSLIRIFLVSLLFGTPVSMLYSLAGGILSLVVMSVLMRLTPLREVTVSVCGGVLHNVGQIGMASIILDTNVVIYYLPALLVSGILAGIAVGVAAGILIKRVPV